VSIIGSSTYILDTLSASALMFMENQRFTDYLRKRNIEFASFQTLVIPVIE